VGLGQETEKGLITIGNTFPVGFSRLDALKKTNVNWTGPDGVVTSVTKRETAPERQLGPPLLVT
jgi:hypothetical protein